MSALEFTVLALLLTGIWYWLDCMRAKEIATLAGAQACQRHTVYFLDESVALTRVRLRRNPAGHIVLYREYRFEFTNDGAYRYHGRIHLLGKQVRGTDMEAYRQAGEH